MQVRELIEELKKYDSDTEVKVFYWDANRKKYEQDLFSVHYSRYGWTGVFLVAEQPNYEPQTCMVGGHDEGCMCNLGFTPRWRNK